MSPAPTSKSPAKSAPTRPPAAPKRTDRLTDVAERRRLDPGSLVGSFFHGGPEDTPLSGHQGCVVAEIVEGKVYLVELFGWLGGDSTCQQLVPLADMMQWQFYDTSEWMNNTYRYGSVPWTKAPARSADDNPFQ